jgi:hypothetical protein
VIEFFGSGILGALIGGIFRIAPEVLKFFDRVSERNHELAMFTLQTELEKMRGEFRVEEKYVDHSTAALDAIQAAFQQQGQADAKAWKWVASMSAAVRPGITFWFMALYTAVKVATIWISYTLNQNMAETIVQTWTEQDFGLFSMILTFWFVGRAIEKYRQ